MYSPFQLALKFANYWFRSSNGKGHGIHSPFVFDFVTKVLNGEGNKNAYASIENIRSRLRQDETIITIEDFGAGSRVTGSKKRKIKQIAGTSLKPRKYSQLLYRMVKHYQPQTILEIGTSLGITSAYLAMANPTATLVTMEGAPAIAATAKTNFDSLGIQNIRQVTGNFDETLVPALSSMQKIDLAFLDGNHRYEPTIRYFQQVLEKSHDYTIIILDDIYWSKEMEEAWQWVKEHPKVTLTIDLFAIGIVVFRPEIRHKQHFCIRY